MAEAGNVLLVVGVVLTLGFAVAILLALFNGED